MLGRRARLLTTTALLIVFMVLTLAPAPIAAAPAAGDKGGAEARAAAALEAARGHPDVLDAFLRRMPKGADLHSHLSGAVYAETFIDLALQDGLCFIVATDTLAPPPCDPVAGRPRLADALAEPGRYDALIDAWSMRNFRPGAESGHDHFFATFDKFNAATGRRGEMLAEVVTRAAGQNIGYLELMVTWDDGEAGRLATRAGWIDDWEVQRQRLKEGGLAAVIARSSANVTQALADMRRILGCDTPAAEPGCAVEVRFLQQTNRLVPPDQFFARILTAFELAHSDPRVVGLNIVAPEDNPAALANFDVQMEMIGFLRARYPDVRVSLHAGELTPDLVGPEDICCHIWKSVAVAGAHRIGHGADLVWERDPEALLDLMRRREVVVETNLTSNEQILGLDGPSQPILIYYRSGVPIVLSTDDEGVSRIDLTHEYRKAVGAHGLGYHDVKHVARNSLTFSFLPGPSLWADWRSAIPARPCAADHVGGADPSAACAAFLAAGPKARQQWQLEAAFQEFEAGF